MKKAVLVNLAAAVDGETLLTVLRASPPAVADALSVEIGDDLRAADVAVMIFTYSGDDLRAARSRLAADSARPWILAVVQAPSRMTFADALRQRAQEMLDNVDAEVTEIPDSPPQASDEAMKKLADKIIAAANINAVEIFATAKKASADSQPESESAKESTAGLMDAKKEPQKAEVLADSQIASEIELDSAPASENESQTESESISEQAEELNETVDGQPSPAVEESAAKVLQKSDAEKELSPGKEAPGGKLDLQKVGALLGFSLKKMHKKEKAKFAELSALPNPFFADATEVLVKMSDITRKIKRGDKKFSRFALITFLILCDRRRKENDGREELMYREIDRLMETAAPDLSPLGLLCKLLSWEFFINDGARGEWENEFSELQTALTTAPNDKKNAVFRILVCRLLLQQADDDSRDEIMDKIKTAAATLSDEEKNVLRLDILFAAYRARQSLNDLLA